MSSGKLFGRVLTILMGTVCLTTPPLQAKTTVEPAKTTQISRAQTAPNISVLFSPDDDVQQAIVRHLNSAQKQILVQAYLLTDNTITNALITAHRRKVNVRVLLDAERMQTAKGSDAVALVQAGIPVKLETAYTNAHNKIILIDPNTDNATLITGSYNFTVTASSKNAENTLFIRNAPEVMRRYVSNWLKHAQKAEAFNLH
ncbi:phospholipase D family protein [Hydromonas duriensis]|uniref:phospholipase D n=1 Tax=Hydromonas duriensis TaxID=1527608 RepID=A0A4R6Y772_9BURK|nr:phospholipase D family protein [Hydromonas duriensis]TDR31169.1 phospholipase D-like protein [Hydromonas duriensis]